MLKNHQSHNDLLPNLFRQEYGKMTAVLCRHFGLKDIEIAEDIASEAFLKASENWPIHGIPENPTAWLFTVAKNKTRDYFKHIKVVEKRIKDVVKPDDTKTQPEFPCEDPYISDSQLSMIFSICCPNVAMKSQICLALQILCGFSVEEIANAFLAKSHTIKKRLQRARAQLRDENFEIKSLSEADIQSRLHAVLKTLYLLFNEGYFSQTNNQLIRRELCSEAIRLTLILTENALTNTPQANALLALMCFQSSRIAARTNEIGETIRFDEQSRHLWDKSLIEKGNYFLVNACTGNEISKYHLEAGIAYWHSTPSNSNKWRHILQLYDQLIQMEYSPMLAVNRIFAYAKVNGREAAIAEALKLNLADSNFYQALLGYLYADKNIDKAILHYRQAQRLAKSTAEKQTLTKEIDRLHNKHRHNVRDITMQLIIKDEPKGACD